MKDWIIGYDEGRIKMFVMREDAEILCSDEVMDMRREYTARFGKRFLMFNYVDFPGTETMRPAEMYREILRKALQENKPCDIVSRRYNAMDH